MGGLFGAVSDSSCVFDLFFGTDYHSHLGTRRGGLVVLSGIIDPQCNAVIEAMEAQGFEKLRELHENDWAGLLMRREG